MWWWVKDYSLAATVLCAFKLTFSRMKPTVHFFLLLDRPQMSQSFPGILWILSSVPLTFSSPSHHSKAKSQVWQTHTKSLHTLAHKISYFLGHWHLTVLPLQVKCGCLLARLLAHTSLTIRMAQSLLSTSPRRKACTKWTSNMMETTYQVSSTPCWMDGSEFSAID